MMNDRQMVPLSLDVLADLPVEELEQRLEMQILRMPEANWGCECDSGTYCSGTNCPTQCTNYTCDTLCTSYCTGGYCGTYCPSQSTCTTYVPIL